MAFYTENLGVELRTDVTVPELGDLRWLTVRSPVQQRSFHRAHGDPWPPVMDAATADRVRELMGKGFAGTVLLTTDDLLATHEELTSRGVVCTEELHEQP